MSEPDLNNKDDVGGPTPGDRLQAARISIGMTVEEVAAKMHLSPAILTNLEENSFDEITAPIFVKGYLRSYARIVRLDEDEIIQQYVRFHAGGDPPISSTSNTAREINAGDARVRGVTWIVILVLLGLLLFWWWNRYQQPAQPVSLESTTPAPSVIVDSLKPAEEPVVLTESEGQDVDPAIQSPGSEVGIVEIEPQPEEEPDFAPVTEPNPGAESSALSAAQEMADGAVLEPEPEQVQAQTDEQSAAVEANPEIDLVIIVNADTWTDIRDADGTKLVYDLLRAGERIELEGKQPFNAFVGNAYGVEISYQGERVDLSSRVRADNTARVRIGR